MHDIVIVVCARVVRLHLDCLGRVQLRELRRLVPDGLHQTHIVHLQLSRADAHLRSLELHEVFKSPPLMVMSR